MGAAQIDAFDRRDNRENAQSQRRRSPVFAAADTLRYATLIWVI
jgi:hypothetical protein